ncbi:hypothetical protein EVB81_172 [Rhizobium phage RHph_I46]|uniref:Transmembrane protein n=1 Tax=Rhizobium phage RHph_I1_9 TaxID=2509729 RepID=A0A7S5UXQ1_9CAUD|nr:hypothetical protein PP936_gp171 [Rhizobium phage RHph_I1_9]QIG69741.1 hypothetical protein EVB81_172 [Rhizobium phage RHph_I46]QIG71022.1 hypothetical protein EVB92_172 [Rhizobium phage RHph_I9]QIG73608.1 hypothetical protein EVC04_171 [Rhizobium phage RHph_I1_9]QIG76361.1 hypothetical protein EVC25_172 [Rhizobium phage RHph_I34]
MTWKQIVIDFIIILIGIISGAIFDHLGEQPDLSIEVRYLYFVGFVLSIGIVIYSLYRASNEIFNDDDDDLNPA